MTNKLIIASAGAGKTERIADEAITRADQGDKVLILTYTENNQKILRERIYQKNGGPHQNIDVKGWFEFLLGDMIRPYQRCIFEKRITGLNFTPNDPHKRNGLTIPGRTVKKNGRYNEDYFLTQNRDKAHSTYLAKLAEIICEETNSPRIVGRKTKKIGLPTKRLENIYDSIFIDEVQDFVGYDYKILDYLSVSKCDVFCVGDFRQTTYRTSPANKNPKTTEQKRKAFSDIGFEEESMNHSYRCVQKICDFSDSIFPEGNYSKTNSKVDLGNISVEDSSHLGVFVVKENKVQDYLDKYTPVILRHNKNMKKELCQGRNVYNFGESKGSGFRRVLIIPTGPQKKFLTGDRSAYSAGEGDSICKFYVAVTRAHLSVAFLFDGETGINGIQKWNN